ncbi:hypothetical protein BFL35_07895 [Clavibacter michiganensis]|nr:hypothetical protein BFL35_07895 [Clavibacter michiganensis]
MRRRTPRRGERERDGPRRREVARVEEQVVDGGAGVLLLDGVDHGAAGDREAAARRVEVRVGSEGAHGHVELDHERVPGGPGAGGADPPVGGRRVDLGGGSVGALHDRGRRAAPARPAEHDAGLRAGRAQHLDAHGAVPRVRGRHADVDRVGADHARGRVRDDEVVTVPHRDVVLQLAHPADDVRRAARAGEPRAPHQLALGLGAGLRVVVGAALERVVVEEARAVGGEAHRVGVQQHGLVRVQEPGLAGREEEAPRPLHDGDGRARLAVGALARQLVGVADGLVRVAAAEPARDVEPRAHGVVEEADGGGEQLGVTRLRRHVRGARGQVRHAHGVTRDGGHLAERVRVLEVLGREDPRGDRAVAAPVDERGREVEVCALPRLAVQLDERHLDLGVPAHLGAPVGAELPHRGVGEPAGDREEAAVAALPGVGDGGLDQVPEVVELVAPGEVRPGLAVGSGPLDVRADVAVVGLHALEHVRRLGEEGAHPRAGDAAPDLVHDALEGLVDVGVEERVARHGPLAGAVHRRAEVVEVAGGGHRRDRVGDGPLPVALLPRAEKAALQGDLPGPERVPGSGGGEHGRATCCRADVVRACSADCHVTPSPRLGWSVVGDILQIHVRVLAMARSRPRPPVTRCLHQGDARASSAGRTGTARTDCPQPAWGGRSDQYDRGQRRQLFG